MSIYFPYWTQPLIKNNDPASFRSLSDEIMFFEENYAKGDSTIIKLENNKKVAKRLKDSSMVKVWSFLIHFEHTMGDNRQKVEKVIKKENFELPFHRLFEYYNSNLNELRGLILSGDLDFDEKHLYIEKTHWIKFSSAGRWVGSC